MRFCTFVTYFNPIEKADFMEKLLHYVWKHKLFPLKALLTTQGQSIEVIDTGLSNPNSGPDFFNAKIKLDDVLWAGNVELHLKASEWYKHSHHTDPAYNNTILHVVGLADGQALCENGKRVPQLVLSIPAGLAENYNLLSSNDAFPRCRRILPQISNFTIHSWLSALLYERMDTRSQLVLQRVKRFRGDWERALFVTLARNFGFGLNGDTFEYWAEHLPLHAVAKHADNPLQVEALFLGTAGILNLEAIPKGGREAAANDEYFKSLQREYKYLAHKFELPPPMSWERWQYLRLRPQNFPHLRLVQLAHLYASHTATLSALLRATDIESMHRALQTKVSPYWETHYMFGYPGPKNEKKLSKSSLNLLVINTVALLLYAYGKQHDQPNLLQRATELLEAIKAENNYITRQWATCGIPVDNAADSQALLQLKTIYCDRHDCLRCRFGYEFLKTK